MTEQCFEDKFCPVCGDPMEISSNEAGDEVWICRGCGYEEGF